MFTCPSKTKENPKHLKWRRIKAVHWNQLWDLLKKIEVLILIKITRSLLWPKFTTVLPVILSFLTNGRRQKYSRLRCLLRVKGLVNCFYLGWAGSILQFRQNITKVGSKSWLLTSSSNGTLNLPPYTGSALKRELKFCNGYLSLLYFCLREIGSEKSSEPLGSTCHS